MPCFSNIRVLRPLRYSIHDQPQLGFVEHRLAAYEIEVDQLFWNSHSSYLEPLCVDPYAPVCCLMPRI